MKKYKELDIIKLWKSYQKDRTLEKRNQLIEYYLPFIEKIAYKVAEKLNWRVSPQELASFGVDGLYRAIEGYNLDRGVKFESYASSRVRGSMIDGLRKEDLIPRSVRIASEQFERHKQRIQNILGRRLSDSEFLEKIGMSEDNYQKNFKRYHPTIFSSLEGAPSKEYEDLKQDFNLNLEDREAAIPEAKVIRKEFFRKLLGKNFSRIEREIIYLYYYEDLTMDKVSKLVGLSESRISQIHKQVMERLRNEIKKNPEYFNDEVFEHIINCNDRFSIV